jgi:acetoin:2,6-dichlorophenolindophenol oxidoreductase subunit beta
MVRRRLIEAINDALVEEMERDPNVVLYGEDVELSILGDVRGLHDRFGPARVRNTPICEATLTGMAVGLAAAGYRPVLHMMFANFLFTGMDAIANQMAKLRLMTGGQMELPITIIASYGAGRSSAAQHSDTPYPVLMNLGGINVLTPATAADAKGLLKTAIRGRDPSVFLEPSGRGGDFGEVPDEDHVIPLGSASIVREGHDVTVVAIGRMVKLAVKAAEPLAADAIDVEIIDPRTLVPFDIDGVSASVAKTGRLVIVDEARERCSAASQISALVAEQGFDHLRAPIRRVTTANVAIPYAPNAEAHVLPDELRIVEAVRDVLAHHDKAAR